MYLTASYITYMRVRVRNWQYRTFNLFQLSIGLSYVYLLLKIGCLRITWNWMTQNLNSFSSVLSHPWRRPPSIQSESEILTSFPRRNVAILVSPLIQRWLSITTSPPSAAASDSSYAICLTSASTLLVAQPNAWFTHSSLPVSTSQMEFS